VCAFDGGASTTASVLRILFTIFILAFLSKSLRPLACLAEALAKAGALVSSWLTFTRNAGKLKEVSGRRNESQVYAMCFLRVLLLYVDRCASD
jgi:hypothetical protein